MIAANRIRWAGIFSNELSMPDLITDCAFDSDNSEVATYLNRESVSSESYDGRNKRVIRMKYTESFAPKFTFIKKGFGDFSPIEVRAILKYLTSIETTGMLEVYKDDSNVIEWCAAGNFSEIQLYKIANSRVVGVTATFDSVHPFALSDLYTVTKTITSTDNKITINIDTDDNKPVYPRVTIKQNGVAGDVKIVNQHYDFFNKASTPVVMTVKNNTATEEIVVDGANKVVRSTNTKRIFGDDFVNWTWLPLYDGKNELTVEGNCTVTFEFREVRKVGEY